MALFEKADGQVTLRAAVGNYPGTQALKSGLIESAILRFEFADITPINRAFAPMAREAKFDVSEMAIGTFLQARAYGKPIVLLPVILAARFQETALLCLSEGKVKDPMDLVGCRIGVRAYSQTTGMWLRGIMKDRFGLRADQVRWITFEDAHVSEYRDPPWAERAAAGKDMMAMLHAGELDAVIVGNDPPKDVSLRQVFQRSTPNAHEFVPINHMLTIRQEIVTQRRDLAEEVLRMFRESQNSNPSTRAEIDPILETALRYAQDLLPHPLTLDEVWAGTPERHLL